MILSLDAMRRFASNVSSANASFNGMDSIVFVCVQSLHPTVEAAMDNVSYDMIFAYVKVDLNAASKLTCQYLRFCSLALAVQLLLAGSTLPAPRGPYPRLQHLEFLYMKR